jgi:hypothetical protein
MSELDQRHEDEPQPEPGRANGTPPGRTEDRDETPVPGNASLDLPLSSPD